MFYCQCKIYYFDSSTTFRNTYCEISNNQNTYTNNELCKTTSSCLNKNKKKIAVAVATRWHMKLESSSPTLPHNNTTTNNSKKKTTLAYKQRIPGLTNERRWRWRACLFASSRNEHRYKTENNNNRTTTTHTITATTTTYWWMRGWLSSAFSHEKLVVHFHTDGNSDCTPHSQLAADTSEWKKTGLWALLRRQHCCRKSCCAKEFNRWWGWVGSGCTFCFWWLGSLTYSYCIGNTAYWTSSG